MCHRDGGKTKTPMRKSPQHPSIKTTRNVCIHVIDIVYGMYSQYLPHGLDSGFAIPSRRSFTPVRYCRETRD